MIVPVPFSSFFSTFETGLPRPNLASEPELEKFQYTAVSSAQVSINIVCPFSSVELCKWNYERCVRALTSCLASRPGRDELLGIENGGRQDSKRTRKSVSEERGGESGGGERQREERGRPRRRSSVGPKPHAGGGIGMASLYRLMGLGASKVICD